MHYRGVAKVMGVRSSTGRYDGVWLIHRVALFPWILHQSEVSVSTVESMYCYILINNLTYFWCSVSLKLCGSANTLIYLPTPRIKPNFNPGILKPFTLTGTKSLPNPLQTTTDGIKVGEGMKGGRVGVGGGDWGRALKQRWRWCCWCFSELQHLLLSCRQKSHSCAHKHANPSRRAALTLKHRSCFRARL